MGRTVGRIKWKFNDGKIVEFPGDASAKPVKHIYEESNGDKDRTGLFAVGFNPKKAQVGYTINNVAMGAVIRRARRERRYRGKEQTRFFLCTYNHRVYFES
jgi:hypothetical protein